MTERDKIARRLLYASGMFDTPAEIAANRDHQLVRDAYDTADSMIADHARGERVKPAKEG